MKRFVPLVCLILALTSTSAATPYWVAWEGNDYPENEGWERRHYRPDGPMADRSLSDGVMTLDGRASTEIQDFYRPQQSINPGAGEEFVVQWKLRVEEVVGFPHFLYDPGFSILSDDAWMVSFVIGVDGAFSILDARTYPYLGGQFRAWELRSPDMRTYSVSVDGQVIGTGSFVLISIRASEVAWGDFTYGSASLSQWDYFRFGVVPEPATGALLVGAAIAGLVGRRGRLGLYSPRRSASSSSQRA